MKNVIEKSRTIQVRDIGAKSNDRNTFSDYYTALEIYKKGDYDGLGIGIFDNVGAIDIDICHKKLYCVFLRQQIWQASISTQIKVFDSIFYRFFRISRE